MIDGPTGASPHPASGCPGGLCHPAARAEGFADFFAKLLDTSDFPRRWDCGSWSDGLGWLHIASDLAIFGAYLSIPLGLAYFLWRRRDLPFPGLIGLFVAFILSCGIGHAVEAGIFWFPAYRLAGLVKAGTAAISWVTVIALVRIMPEALKLPDIARLNEQLRRSEAEARKLALVAARTHNAVIITDAQGRIEWVNDGFTRITGYTPPEAVGRTPGALLQGPATDPATVALMRDRLGAGEGFQVEAVNYRKSGEPYWVAIEVQPIRDESGGLTHFMAIEAEVTERKRADRELRERTRLSALGADVGLALTREPTLADQLLGCTEAMVRHLDAAFARIWTLEPGDETLALQASSGRYAHLDGPHARIPVGSKKIGRIAEERRPLLVNGVADDPAIGDRDWARREGMVAFAGYPLLVQTRVVGVMALFARRELDGATFEAMGAVANAIALGIEREQDAAALRASESRKAAILATALDAIVIMDDRGRVLEFNPAAEATFGYAAAEAIGRPMEDLIIPPAHREAHRLGLRRYRETGASRVLGKRLEVSAIRRDGEEFPVELAITPIHAGGQTVFTGHIRDITTRRQHEESLRVAKQRAEEASRAKSFFLANMSHEIRTPMTAVLGFAEVLRRGVADEAERREHVETIAASGRHLLAIIDDILDLSKIEAGRMEYRIERCAPHAVLAEVASILRVRAAEKGLTLECAWAGGGPESIETDPVRLRQLLMNLIGNAIKFTERGGVQVTASVDRDAPAPRLALEIRDTGIGIAPDCLERIFSPFDQGDGSITRRYGGTGLGLAISRHIARALGGDLTAASEPGVGSVFLATIATGPLDGVPMLDRPAAEAVTPAMAGGGPPARLDGVRILLVEDGATNRKLIGLLLRRAGADVTFAEDGAVGVAAAAAARFDLILMDMQMPVLDGYEATRRIRAAGHAGPILALTAHAMRGEAEACLAAGCDAHLAKPVDHETLLSTIRAFLPAPAPAPPRPDGGVGEPLTSTLPVDDPEFREIVAEFVETLGSQSRTMRDAWSRGDREALGRLAHWLRGAGGTAGFDALTDPARRLGRAARDGSGGDVEAVLTEIEALVGRVAAPDAPASAASGS